MPRKVIASEKAPRAIGPYSPAIQTPLYAYTAGQIGLDPDTRELVSGGIEAETRQTLTNLSNLLEAAGTSLAAVVKTTVFLRDMAVRAHERCSARVFRGTTACTTVVSCATDECGRRSISAFP
jgi:reactive intermediate/imine deaminase